MTNGARSVEPVGNRTGTKLEETEDAIEMAVTAAIRGCKELRGMDAAVRAMCSPHQMFTWQQKVLPGAVVKAVVASLPEAQMGESLVLLRNVLVRPDRHHRALKDLFRLCRAYGVYGSLQNGSPDFAPFPTVPVSGADWSAVAPGGGVISVRGHEEARLGRDGTVAWWRVQPAQARSFAAYLHYCVAASVRALIAALERRPAERYDAPSDLWVITCYFNSHGYATKRQNYRRFEESMLRSGVNLLVMECAFGDAPFELPDAPHLRRTRSADVIWQKECLLNVMTRLLPESCTKVAWLDCDVLFENPHWASATSRLLDDVPVVQPYERVVRLPRGHGHYQGVGETYDGFGAVLSKYPSRSRECIFERHGHTGFAWAARRDLLLRHGLFDACIAGSADHVIAHAALGDWDSSCITRMVGTAKGYRDRLVRWAMKFYGDVQGRIGFVPGWCLHLWHGAFADRKYTNRNQELVSLGFNPAVDLRLAKNGCWEWTGKNPALRTWAKEYFALRNEDGASRPDPDR